MDKTFITGPQFAALCQHLEWHRERLLEYLQSLHVHTQPNRGWTDTEQRMAKFLRTLATSEIDQTPLSYDIIAGILNRSSHQVFTFLNDIPALQKPNLPQSAGSQWLEQHIKNTFKSYRLMKEYVLKPTSLRLDFYLPQLRVGFEYDGAQHYQFVDHFHKDHRGFVDMKIRDQKKEALCQARGIQLIRFGAHEQLTKKLWEAKLMTIPWWKNLGKGMPYQRKESHGA